MEDTPRLYHTLVGVLGQPGQWLDVRHLQTLVWMIVGLLQSGLISLTQGAPFVQGRAELAQSTVRRFSRWLDNERIVVHQLYGPLIQAALAEEGQDVLYLALDTSLLWDSYCLIRISLLYRGQAIPLVWQVLAHHSSSVAHSAYPDLLTRAAALLPAHCRVVFMADRGFADTKLMGQLKELRWHWPDQAQLLRLSTWPAPPPAQMPWVGPWLCALLAPRVHHQAALRPGPSGCGPPGRQRRILARAER